MKLMDAMGKGEHCVEVGVVLEKNVDSAQSRTATRCETYCSRCGSSNSSNTIHDDRCTASPVSPLSSNQYRTSVLAGLVRSGLDAVAWATIHCSSFDAHERFG